MDLSMNLVNAGKASFAHAWTGYNTCASYDRQHWFRVLTSYEASSGVLNIQHKPEQVSRTTVALQSHYSRTTVALQPPPPPPPPPKCQFSS